MELGAHDEASLLRVALVWSRPMDSTSIMSGQRIGRASSRCADQVPACVAQSAFSRALTN